MDYGYIRVSSKDQNERRQLDAMAAQGICGARLFLDKQSGKDFKRPAYQKLVRKLKPGDLLVLPSIDRLGRNYREIMEEWRFITKEKRANIRVLDMPLLDTTRQSDLMGILISDIVLQLLSFVAENERDNIKKRQREGIEAAMRRGVRFGRPEKPIPPDFQTFAKLWRERRISVKEAAERLHMPPTTFYRKARNIPKGTHYDKVEIRKRNSTIFQR